MFRITSRFSRAKTRCTSKPTRFDLCWWQVYEPCNHKQRIWQVFCFPVVKIQPLFGSNTFGYNLRASFLQEKDRKLSTKFKKVIARLPANNCNPNKQLTMKSNDCFQFKNKYWKVWPIINTSANIPDAVLETSDQKSTCRSNRNTKAWGIKQDCSIQEIWKKNEFGR